MASSCHLNWTELYKNAKLLKKGALILHEFPRDAHLLELSIWSANAHTHTHSILFWFVLLICCLLSMTKYSGKIHLLWAHPTDLASFQRTAKNTQSGQWISSIASQSVTPRISKIYKFICLANDCRISNSLDVWVSWSKKNGFNILCSYQRCYGTPRIDAGPHIPTATKLLLVSVKNHHPVLRTIFLFSTYLYTNIYPCSGFQNTSFQKSPESPVLFNIFCFLKEIFRRITWPPPTNKKQPTAFHRSHLPSLSIGLLPLGSFGSRQFFLHLFLGEIFRKGFWGEGKHLGAFHHVHPQKKMVSPPLKKRFGRWT